MKENGGSAGRNSDFILNRVNNMTLQIDRGGLEIISNQRHMSVVCCLESGHVVKYSE